MSSGFTILSRALSDRFRRVSNAISIGQDFVGGTLNLLVRAANKSFEDSDDISVGGTTHFVMDINEAAKGSPLRPDHEKTYVVFLTIHDTCKSDLRSQFVSLPEPGLLLRYHSNGKVECITTKNSLPDEHVTKLQIARSETLRAANHNGIEDFVASWLRVNFNAKTMVAIEKALDRQCQTDGDAFWVWSKAQRDRFQALDKG